MIEVVLDTNILHQEGLNSGRMQVLKRLIDVEFVRIHIPEIVKKEFISKKIHTTSDLMIKAANNLKTINSNFEKSDDFKIELQKIETDIRTKIEDIKNQIIFEYESWESDFRVNKLQFEPEDIESVMDDYFLGQGVYRSIKSREDIPDAMINTSIDRLILEVGDINVLIKDSTFKKHLTNNLSVTVYDGLSDFLKTQTIEALTNKVMVVDNVKDYFESIEANLVLTNYFRELDEDISLIYVEDEGLLNKDILADRVYSAQVNYPLSSNIENLKIDSLYALTAEKFVGDISFETDATVHFISDYRTYLDIQNDKNRNVDIDSMNGDGLCDLYESYKVRYSGQVEIILADSFEKSVVEVLMKSIKNNVGAISINFNMELCELLIVDA